MCLNTIFTQLRLFGLIWILCFDLLDRTKTSGNKRMKGKIKLTPAELSWPCRSWKDPKVMASLFLFQIGWVSKYLPKQWGRGICRPSCTIHKGWRLLLLQSGLSDSGGSLKTKQREEKQTICDNACHKSVSSTQILVAKTF